jgi:hypothetical protein
MPPPDFHADPPIFMIVIGGWGYSNQKPIMIMERRRRAETAEAAAGLGARSAANRAPSHDREWIWYL